MSMAPLPPQNKSTVPVDYIIIEATHALPSLPPALSTHIYPRQAKIKLKYSTTT